MLQHTPIKDSNQKKDIILEDKNWQNVALPFIILSCHLFLQISLEGGINFLEGCITILKYEVA